MASRTDFSPEEWGTIYQSPAMAGMVVMTAGKSGPIQAMQEMFAVSKALADAQENTTNGLISGIIEAARNKEKIEPATQPKTIEEAHTLALDHMRNTAELINSRAPDEATEFKTWLIGIGQKVAEAAKEGGFLGFGGVQVTDDERAALQELQTALGVS